MPKPSAALPRGYYLHKVRLKLMTDGAITVLYLCKGKPKPEETLDNWLHYAGYIEGKDDTAQVAKARAYLQTVAEKHRETGELPGTPTIPVSKERRCAE